MRALQVASARQVDWAQKPRDNLEKGGSTGCGFWKTWIQGPSLASYQLCDPWQVTYPLWALSGFSQSPNAYFAQLLKLFM